MRTKFEKFWVAVKIERGFPVEVKCFRSAISAEKQEDIWRDSMNIDYDETGVLEAVVKCNRKPNKREMRESCFKVQSTRLQH